MNISKSPGRGRFKRGFTMVEILVVVIIVAGLLALVTPPLVGVMEANRLTQSGQSLLFRISMAKQMALTQNRPVELRFFRYADDNGFEGYHAAQMFFYEESTANLEEIEAPVYFSTGIMIPDGVFSPLFASQGTSESLEAEREPFKSRGATYRKIIFYPNGSTGINLPLREAYLTLCAARSNAADATTPPTNFYTIQIDPINGSTKTYQPE